MPHTTKEKRNNPSNIVYRHGHHIPASKVIITYFSMLGTSKIYTTEVHRSIFVLSIFAR